VRLSDADRERLFDQLKVHAAEGRIGMSELERRVAAIAEAQTREQVAAVMADLPPLPASASRRRGHGEADVPDPAWAATPERFRDPRSGRVMRVWVDSAGGRHYVAED
jgi:uncharacterized protein DUF1707